MGDILTEIINALQAVIGNSGANAVAAFFTRHTGTLNTDTIAVTIKLQTSGNMATGFGPTLGFYIRDDAGSDTLIATIGAYRSGADNTGAIILKTYTAGSAAYTFTLTASLLTLLANLTLSSGILTCGTAGTNRGAISAVYGSGGNTPGYLVTYSPNGTPYYWFAEDDGTAKIHNAVPTQNADGQVIGLQF